MHVSTLTLRNVRNIHAADITLAPGLTVVHGANGQGKTNLLEAIYLLAIGKSYRTANERDLIPWLPGYPPPGLGGAGALSLIGATVERRDGPLSIRVALEPGSGNLIRKRVTVNGVAKRISDLVGRFNAVLFAASDLSLVDGPPADRRRYLDVLLCQVSPPYLRTLQRYQRVVTQRNALLRSLRDGRAAEAELAYWDDALAREGATLIAARTAAVPPVAAQAQAAFARLAPAGDSLTLAYVPAVPAAPSDDRAAIESAFTQALVAGRAQERAAAQTLIGPHRDDLRLSLGTVDATRYASRGQARLIALALRLAEAQFLADRRGEAPVLLLDDTLSELDPERRVMVVAESRHYPQTVLTTADLSLVPRAALSGCHLLLVDAGRVAACPARQGEGVPASHA